MPNKSTSGKVPAPISPDPNPDTQVGYVLTIIDADPSFGYMDWAPPPDGGGPPPDSDEFVKKEGDVMTGSLSITGNSRLLIQSIFGPNLGAGTIRLEGGQTTTIQFCDPAGMRFQLIESHYDDNQDLVLIRGAFPGTICLIVSHDDGHVSLRRPSTLDRIPIGPDELTSKTYVDDLVASIPPASGGIPEPPGDTNIYGRVAAAGASPASWQIVLGIRGGGMLGRIQLNNNFLEPITDDEVVCKRYVDSKAGGGAEIGAWTNVSYVGGVSGNVQFRTLPGIIQFRGYLTTTFDILTSNHLLFTLPGNIRSSQSGWGIAVGAVNHSIQWGGTIGLYWNAANGQCSGNKAGGDTCRVVYFMGVTIDRN
jgi:hypothetical protein